MRHQAKESFAPWQHNKLKNMIGKTTIEKVVLGKKNKAAPSTLNTSNCSLSLSTPLLVFSISHFAHPFLYGPSSRYPCPPSPNWWHSHHNFLMALLPTLATNILVAPPPFKVFSQPLMPPRNNNTLPTNTLAPPTTPPYPATEPTKPLVST